MTQSTEIATQDKVRGDVPAGAMVEFRGGKAPALAVFLASKKNQLAAVVRNNLDSEKICRSVISAVTTNAKLSACTCISVYQSLVMSLELGLQVGPGLGEAFLVPFKGVCTFMIGYKGLTTLAYRSGVIDDITAVTVYKADKFAVKWHLTPPLEHEPDMLTPREDKDIVAFYCLVSIRGKSTPHFAYRTKGEVDLVRSRSAGRDSDPWILWYSEQGMKTTIKHTLKPFPKSPDMAKAIAWDNALESRRYDQVIPFDHEDLADLPMVPEDPDPATESVQRAREQDAANRALKKPADQMAAPEGHDFADGKTHEQIRRLCKEKGVICEEVCMEIANKPIQDLSVAQGKLVIAHLQAL